MSTIADDIIQGLEEAAKHAAGNSSENTKVHIPNEINVSRIREKLGLSQLQFSEKYGISLGTVRDWEQGRRVPSGPAKLLLIVIDKESEAVNRALQAS